METETDSLTLTRTICGHERSFPAQKGTNDTSLFSCRGEIITVKMEKILLNKKYKQQVQPISGKITSLDFWEKIDTNAARIFHDSITFIFGDVWSFDAC